MKRQNLAEQLKNAAGAMFLLAAAFFVCSTLISMRAVLADPIAPATQVGYVGQQGQVAGNPRRAANARVVNTARTTTAPTAINSSRNAVARTTASRVTQSTANRANAASGQTRGVAQRAVTTRTAAPARSVAARSGTVANTARVGVSGPAIRASTSNSSSSALQSRLYTGNYSTIVDPSTGLISADAYSNCLNSYYTCMDEICTARNQSQRRCACAGRVKTFIAAEQDLEAANEQLIAVSGQLALLIATKGKDVSAAFTLTEAEQVMNCVAWQNAVQEDKLAGSNSKVKVTEYCNSHFLPTAECSTDTSPKYCSASAGGNNFGFEIDNLTGGASDILAQLKSWATAKDLAARQTAKNNENLLTGIMNMTNIVGDLTGKNMFGVDSSDSDQIASTWGYDLFEYAHNNVCARVLDSCFNGIYETCGAGGTAGTKPSNITSNVSIGSNGNDLSIGNWSESTNKTCFGYSTTGQVGSTDPYEPLRKPVYEARRSILNKYVLDANADCDLYGEQLRTTAQNIGYQKVAAQQALQKKRLEFAQEETTANTAALTSAVNNFNNCVSQIYECYENYASSENWTESRIKSYCQTTTNVPACYQQMVCGLPQSSLKAVIDDSDVEGCDPLLASSTKDGKKACRNVVTLNEILNGVANGTFTSNPTDGNSAQLREKCIQNSIGTGADSLRSWKKPTKPTT